MQGGLFFCSEIIRKVADEGLDIPFKPLMVQYRKQGLGARYKFESSFQTLYGRSIASGASICGGIEMDLIDKLAAWMDGRSTEGLFSAEERQLLETIEEFEAIRRQGQAAERNSAGGRDANAVFRTLEREKEISLRLKSVLFSHMDHLLAKRSIEGWVEVMAWYNFVEGRRLMEQFWEFYILKILIGIYAEEWKVFSQGGAPVCMLQFGSTAELTEGYFRVLFLLRRLEYGIEPQDEIADYMRDRGLSLIYIDKVVERSQIREKETVKAAVRGLCRQYGIG